MFADNCNDCDDFRLLASLLLPPPPPWIAPLIRFLFSLPSVCRRYTYIKPGFQIIKPKS